jgi:DNA-binding transcriptional LysR family regulator
MQWERHIGRRLKLRDLYILMAVVDARGMGRAANHLNMSQPAVSQAIADLEHAIGARLVERSRQGVEPTPYGRALIKRGTAVFDELRQGVKEIEFLADPTAGELRIGTSEPVAAAIVSDVIERLTKKHPRVAFHILTGHTATLYRELSERRVELVITRSFEPVADDHMDTEILYDDTHVVVAGIKSRWLQRRKIGLADLVDEPWILPPLDSFYGSLIEDAFRSSGLDVPRTAVFTFSWLLRESLVGTGRFLTTVPGFMMRSPAKHPWLKALPVELPATRRPISIVTLKNRMLSPVAELFVTHVREVAKKLASAR